MKVGVCEAPPELEVGTPAWEELCRRVRQESPDLFVLNEMPFGRWIAAAPEFDRGPWEDAVAAHENGLARLGELGASAVAGSRARELEGRRVNEAFLWSADAGVRGIHTKQFFPDEEGYHEARWFEGGERHFHVAEQAGFKAGFLLCTEMMFNERARAYGRDGAQLILSPRAVGEASLRRWLVAMRMAAVVSGCYVLTSNRGGTDANGQLFGGRGWIIDPAGDLVAQTSADTPVAFHDIDLEFVERAQKEYPCYVKE